MEDARQLPRHRPAAAPAHGEPPPPRRRLYEAVPDAAASWSLRWRVVRHADVRPAGAPPRLVGPARGPPAPQRLYEARSGARGACENRRKAVQCALPSDRPSAPTCLANAMRVLLAWGAEGLHHPLRTQTWQQTALAHAPPSTVILTRCTGATRVKP